MPTSASFMQFLRAFTGHWFIWMSGGLSVPLVIAATLFENFPAKIGLLLLALAAFVFASYSIWKPERTEVVSLSERLRPKVRCLLAPDIQGCVVPTRIDTSDGSVQAIYYRLRMEGLSELPIGSVSATIVKVARDGQDIYDGGSLPLNIAPAERVNPTEIDLRPLVPEFADVLVVTEQNLVFFPMPIPNALDMATLNFRGDYLFSIVVSAPTSPSVQADLRFKWTGSAETAEMVLA